MSVTLVVHGHFYQPPREDPVTGLMPVELGAAPWHDFNAKICAECYHPNAMARVVDQSGRLVDLVNNYEHISFNVGPTLFTWLHSASPRTMAHMLRAGRNAMAQAYNHAILPLCNERDLRTQIRWGLADFRFRFGHEAEGMWLPETAVDETVLAALAVEGVRFTILAPRQAARVRPLGTSKWEAANETTLDTSVLYRSTSGVTVFFYDGHLSSDVAFGIRRLSSEAFVEQVLAGGQSAHRSGGLVMIATDGETFGHHHPFADRTLAFALTRVAAERGVRVATANEIVRTIPPTSEVEVSRSAWSCAHGVGRWSTDCGCAINPGRGWHQRWRAPLREALDVLRDAGAAVFERRGEGVLRDPWAARDQYIEVVQGSQTWEGFFAEHGRGDLEPAGEIARTLLEAQRYAMAMYTSCGWFFDDIAGLEVRIVLKNAAALIDTLARLDEHLPEQQAIRILATAPGNEHLNGADAWRSVRFRHAGEPSVPAGGWAPPVSPQDAALEAVWGALRAGTPIEPDAVVSIAAALGFAPAATGRT